MVKWILSKSEVRVYAILLERTQEDGACYDSNKELTYYYKKTDRGTGNTDWQWVSKVIKRLYQSGMIRVFWSNKHQGKGRAIFCKPYFCKIEPWIKLNPEIPEAYTHLSIELPVYDRTIDMTYT